jgi:hypothetical protein
VESTEDPVFSAFFLFVSLAVVFWNLSCRRIQPLPALLSCGIRGGVRPDIARVSRIRVVMHPLELGLFEHHLKGINNYFEFGSGGSTAQAAIKARYVVSVENDAQWHASLRERLGPCGNIFWYTIDHKVTPGQWGKPGADSDPGDWRRYTHAYNASFAADLILIDGRFRVSCALCVWSHITDQTVVIIHDFRSRPHYWVIMPWYDLVESAGSLVVVRKKTRMSPPPAEMIQWYDKHPFDEKMPGIEISPIPWPEKG